MYIAVYHQIDQPDVFFGIIGQNNPIPKGLILHAFYPADHGATAVCLWEADNKAIVERFLKEKFGATVRNECMEVNEIQAHGLPKNVKA